MADLAKYNWKYVKEAVIEPVNFWGLAGFAVAAAYTQSVIPLAVALGMEGVYLASVPANKLYKKLVDNREKDRIRQLRDVQREKLIKAFDPREREAVEYLRWLKEQIYTNYKKFTASKEVPQNIKTLDRKSVV